MRMILGREPALWTGAIVAVLSALATFGTSWLSAGQAFAVAGLVTAVVTALTTRPIGPGLFTGLLTAVVAVMAEYGTALPESQVAVLSTLVLAAFTLLTRQQVSPPADAPVTGVLGNKVTTDTP